jgi:hypothetical protein
MCSRHFFAMRSVKLFVFSVPVLRGKHSIAQAAIRVLADSQLASTVSRAAWTRVQNNFLVEHFTERFRRVLAKLLPSCRKSSEVSAGESLQAPTHRRADAGIPKLLE